MDIENVISLALGSTLLEESLADEVLNYGISAFLEAGCSYEDALSLIETATLSKSRATNEKLFYPEEKVDES